MRKIIWKWLKRLIKWTSILLLLLIIGVTLFLYLSPQFGGDATEEDIVQYKKTGHYKEGQFQNTLPTSRGFSWKTFQETLYDYYKGNPSREPQVDIPVEAQDSVSLNQPNQIMWFGHSAFYVHLEGKSILLDPMLTETPSPVSFLSKSRYSKVLPIEISDLPQIDYIFISHDHYDHLDYESIQALKAKTRHFIVPIGVDIHLKAWGVPAASIHAYNWWEKGKVDGLNFVFTPSRHFSGRSIGDHNATLWGSWVILGKKHKLYFSGDGGYGPHFKEIGEKYGPFDFAMLECGQYNTKWKQIHMIPEETAQAAKDINTKVAMPIHWGAFTLSLHDWYEPPERMLKKSKELDIPTVTPKIGAILNLDTVMITQRWWEPYK